MAVTVTHEGAIAVVVLSWSGRDQRRICVAEPPCEACV